MIQLPCAVLLLTEHMLSHTPVRYKSIVLTSLITAGVAVLLSNRLQLCYVLSVASMSQERLV